ncbi:hypothetical protein HU200_034130 [Digitaria exilis]|uniref:Uncharacterized protein n=1 Tax=Digitaria exilis TaxID=1010633 RepID=A0A835BKK6_9POAL|nr:hypothetical protein HU200_034130 [Digitaria exilis]
MTEEQMFALILEKLEEINAKFCSFADPLTSASSPPTPISIADTEDHGLRDIISTESNTTATTSCSTSLASSPPRDAADVVPVKTTELMEMAPTSASVFAVTPAALPTPSSTSAPLQDIALADSIAATKQPVMTPARCSMPGGSQIGTGGGELCSRGECEDSIYLSLFLLLHSPLRRARPGLLLFVSSGVQGERDPELGFSADSAASSSTQHPLPPSPLAAGILSSACPPDLDAYFPLRLRVCARGYSIDRRIADAAIRCIKLELSKGSLQGPAGCPATFLSAPKPRNATFPGAQAGTDGTGA